MKGIRLVIILFSLVIVTGCSQRPRHTDQDVMTKPTQERYQATEIMEYNGARLDPSIGPRDNSISGIIDVELESYSLKITGLVENEVSFTYDEVLEKEAYERLITLYCVEGWDATVLWEGVRITDLLDEAKPNEAGQILIFRCLDGYTTSIPLEEVKEKDMLLAYNSNKIPLPAALGAPFIVVAQDKLGYKWARWVEEIEVSDQVDYEGTWEKRGYDNDANIP